MARPKNAVETTRVAPTLPRPAYAQLERLAEMGMFGSNPSDVARYLLTRALDDLMRTGVIGRS